MSDFLFRGTIAEIDPKINKLIEIEEERQYRRLILIPSESTSPRAVRDALSCGFHNVYAEGYPIGFTLGLEEDDIFDYDMRLAEYRRYSDARYYKGVEYADILEAVAGQRVAEAFEVEGYTADDIYVNIQPLSGGPANNAVYHALVKPGDPVLGMNLLHGGHLSHGSRVNRSGAYYNITSYSVDPKTERIDYDEIERLALKNKPKMIIAGVSSYSWKLDWARFREIADQVGAYLFADISHVAGLIVGGVYPSPIGYAHVITSTTHKTFCGPRGAIVMSTERAVIKKIDRAVFPGEQGGPHVNVFAALAIAAKIAKTDQFRELQEQIIKNTAAITERLEKRGFRIPFGGTDTHLMNIDTKSVRGKDGAWLSGDLAARILDIAGIVTNRNTIPGDKSALNPSGVRMGTPWITQRGFKEKETIQMADIIADILHACEPYYQGRQLRAKIDFKVLEEAKIKVRNLAESAGIDFKPTEHGYPHFYYLDDKPTQKAKSIAYEIGGERVRQFMNIVASSDVESLDVGQSQPARICTPEGDIVVTLTCVEAQRYRLTVPAEKAGLVLAWLRAISDGYIKIDADLLRKVPGPVWVRHSAHKVDDLPSETVNPVDLSKPYFLGILPGEGDPLPDFEWEEPEAELRRTPLYDLHVKLGGRMVPFAGWEMPVRYGSLMEEHMATRNAAGLFDVAHMGVYQAEGPDAAVFLDSVTGNDISSLNVGESLYTHFLSPDAQVFDDLLVYRRAEAKYLIVVNASNDDKDWAWLNAVREGKVKVDNARPWVKAFGRRVVLRNLRDPKEGADMRVNIAIQGPLSRKILLSLGVSREDRKRVKKLKWAELCEITAGGFDLVVSRTGYTGERMAFELFVHPDRAEELFKALMKVGEPIGLIPCGLGARDSLRTEAGLPLYGHEMGGEMRLGVAEAGFGSYVKTYKPWFIGRDAYLAREAKRDGVVVRFRFDDKRVRMAHLGDPVMESRGRVIGSVTSCAADSEGYLLGQAYIQQRYAKKGTKIIIYPDASKWVVKDLLELNYGEWVSLPETATVLRRFPK